MNYFDWLDELEKNLTPKLDRNYHKDNGRLQFINHCRIPRRPFFPGKKYDMQGAYIESNTTDDKGA